MKGFTIIGGLLCALGVVTISDSSLDAERSIRRRAKF